ncbi:MAG: NAD(P)H-dependent glycerol-3-phosphate dehydrogenase [Holosporaceae bacterium]|jgi:glycerol-3-phosphate dehydrogenase (NAD(P)+)|nr:NAD(P)H-dependent glycerol-3-phosphate dehydrogenase [Holosporaceae bacterium]
MVFLKKIGIVGAGNYGTAIAQCFSRKAEEVLLISIEDAVTTNIEKLRMNMKSLPGVLLNPNISCSSVFSRIQCCDVVFLAVPLAAVASVCRQIKDNGAISSPVILCSKGFDVENGRLQSDLFEDVLGNDYAIFSGPSFAREIAQGLPAGVNIASKKCELAMNVAESLSSEMFKIEAIDDPVGLQVAGALKNVLAIGCGILSGLKLGNSAIAKLITEGLGEMSAMAIALGGKGETISKLGGVGDTVLTCTSRQSRNVLFGEYLAADGDRDEWTGPLVEGAFASRAIPAFCRKLHLDLGIFSCIHSIIYEKTPAIDLILEIMHAR